MARKPYGVGTTPYGMYVMTQNYRAAADALEHMIALPHLTDSPRRFLYYQALEHFLRAYLHLNGHKLASIQALGHKWEEMLDLCRSRGLTLPSEAEEFIRSSATTNELVRVRYELDENAHRPPPTLPIEKAIYALEIAVGEAIEATGREVFKRSKPALHAKTKAR